MQRNAQFEIRIHFPHRITTMYRDKFYVANNVARQYSDYDVEVFDTKTHRMVFSIRDGKEVVRD